MGSRSRTSAIPWQLDMTRAPMAYRVCCQGIAEVRLRLPNRHHLLVDLEPFGLHNPGEVFHVVDRPYGLIEATVLAEGQHQDDGAW